MATETLTWALPTTRTDGAAISPDEIAGTSVFDTTSPTPDVAIGSVPGAGTSFTTDVLSVGVHNFIVVITDTTGHMSAASNVVSQTVPAVLANPNPAVLSGVFNP